MESVNLIALVVAAIVDMTVGMVWYARPVAGTIWMRLTGLTDEEIKSGNPLKAIGLSLFCALVFAYVLSYFAMQHGVQTLDEGLEMGLWFWIAYCVLTLPGYLFEQRPIKLFAVHAGYKLIAILGMSAVIAVV